MKDASEVPQPFKRYEVSNAELKAALGIDWPGKILSVSKSYELFGDGFIVTMYTQPHELSGADRDRLTAEVPVRMPGKDPAEKPAGNRKRWWRL